MLKGQIYFSFGHNLQNISHILVLVTIYKMYPQERGMQDQLNFSRDTAMGYILCNIGHIIASSMESLILIPHHQMWMISGSAWCDSIPKQRSWQWTISKPELQFRIWRWLQIKSTLSTLKFKLATYWKSLQNMMRMKLITQPRKLTIHIRWDIDAEQQAQKSLEDAIAFFENITGTKKKLPKQYEL